MELIILQWSENGTVCIDKSWTVPVPKKHRKGIVQHLKSTIDLAIKHGCRFSPELNLWRNENLSVSATLVTIKGRKEVKVPIDEKGLSRLCETC